MEYIALGFIAASLTIAMFATKNSLLGFPSAIFWAILGVYAYSESTIAFGDWQYLLFFSSTFGMVAFSALAAFALREKRDSYGEKSVQGDDNKQEEDVKESKNMWGY